MLRLTDSDRMDVARQLIYANLSNLRINDEDIEEAIRTLASFPDPSKFFQQLGLPEQFYNYALEFNVMRLLVRAGLDVKYEPAKISKKVGGRGPDFSTKIEGAPITINVKNVGEKGSQIARREELSVLVAKQTPQKFPTKTPHHYPPMNEPGNRTFINSYLEGEGCNGCMIMKIQGQPNAVNSEAEADFQQQVFAQFQADFNQMRLFLSGNAVEHSILVLGHDSRQYDLAGMTWDRLSRILDWYTTSSPPNDEAERFFSDRSHFKDFEFQRINSGVVVIEIERRKSLMFNPLRLWSPHCPSTIREILHAKPSWQEALSS